MPLNFQALAKILHISELEADLQTNHPHITNLILIPHRDLHLFPIQALFSANFQSSYLPSLQFGLLNPNQDIAISAQTSPKFLSIENPIHTSPDNSKKIAPLPLAEIESDLSCTIMPNSTAIKGTNASKSVIQTEIPKYTLFHFTGHAYFDFDNPINSALLLKDTDTFTIKDISELDLSPYFLIFLSGCETGITGKQTIEHEYIGLNSIFMYAGANCVISTLWTIPAAASALISIRFYQNYFQKNLLAITALAEAQTWLKNATIADLIAWVNKLPNHDTFLISTLLTAINEDSTGNIEINNSKPYQHPYYWASFTIQQFSL
jgi:CHAT domain-containing protein